MKINVDDIASIEQFLFKEAELLDDGKFKEWHALFTSDATYRIPINEDADPQRTVLIANYDPLRLDEKVYHVSDVPFAAQSPRSRVLHLVSNVRISSVDKGLVNVRSTQLVREMRLGDFRQTGLGEPQSLSADVRHTLEPSEDSFRIRSKTIHLLERGTPLGNLTFLI